jgi:hypothetical protein
MVFLVFYESTHLTVFSNYFVYRKTADIGHMDIILLGHILDMSYGVINNFLKIRNQGTESVKRDLILTEVK